MTIVVLESLTFGLRRLVEAASDLGERLCLLTQDPDFYQHELASLREDQLDVVLVDTFDQDAVRKAIDALPGVRGLISSTDTWAVAGAELAEQFGLPGLAAERVRFARDKFEVRNLLWEKGLSSGAAERVTAAELDIELLSRATGLPAVVKDSAGTGSRNVWLVRDAADLDVLRAEAEAATLTGTLLAEPFLHGPVYSAETLTWRGHTRLLGVSSRLMSPPPRFVESVTAFPVAFPQHQLAELSAWVGKVLAAVGYTDRFAHVEFAMTATGPEVIEINPRIGGAQVAESMCRALGYNVYRAAVQLALGERPELIGTELPGGPAVAFTLSYPEETGIFTEVSGLSGLYKLPGAPQWLPTKRPGVRIEHLGDHRGCVGMVLAEAETAELAVHRVVAAAGTIRVRTSEV
ncbi:ATP-grasp domain-containing protein [Allokutzneria sp. A3M-2-11 16]|uniref:ATP-grasp domain-containing protein n=1 Tax=Allokutzneria sp. A3M-2-11 16 TaxID=2962043 RepID=UPI0020B7C690|nr:ATP-grasp domain-containing protein [Allokutzneria sp. A3M-2-11 16]MCP3802178.1 ATP-grasp domain-containing protein [Allokutzneria sp. A3M-2-11 16]